MAAFLFLQSTFCTFKRSNLIVVQGSPADMFKAIDENGDGSVSFDEWLGFAYKNYQVSDIGSDLPLKNCQVLVHFVMDGNGNKNYHALFSSTTMKRGDGNLDANQR